MSKLDITKLITLDVEVYKNYLLVMFKKISSGDVIYFEKFNDSPLNIKNILHILNKYTIVTFNGNKYDLCILEAAVAGFTNSSIKGVSNMIIDDNMQPWQVRKQVGIPALAIDHIDLIEVAPLKASLKIYGGRIRSKRLKDLPIEPEATILESDLPAMREYCEIDLDVTALLLKQLTPEIELRCSMSEEYKVDVRSKSDAQIAESVIKNELLDKYGIKAKRPKIEKGTQYRYKAPSNLVFQTPLLQDVFRQYTTLPFTVESSGHISFNFEMTDADRLKSGKNKGKLPEKKGKLQFTIGDTKYTVGVGGIHSCEKSIRHTNDTKIIRDYDVASFYPRIVLNNKLTPKHLGKPFLEVYESIVNRRLKSKSLQKKAKEAGNKKEEAAQKVINESLKITINGSFGKLGNKWSCLYSPDLMMQVTVTGQLSLLMLIERLEMAGISVISANTDGIVVKMDPELEDMAEEIVSDWEFDTDYEMESTDYISLNSRDINNYIAVKEKGVKGKGAYADQREHYYALRSNPTNEICSEAVKKFLQDGTCFEETIRSCDDITKFVTLRTVNGGAIKDGELIGKAIRWYYGEHELDSIYYSTSGNKVPRSDGAVPLMDLPEEFPEDIDFNWYIEEAKLILKNIGYKL